MTTRNADTKRSIPWSAIVEEDLADHPEEWPLLLNECLEDGPEVFLVALKHVVAAQKRGVSGVAEATGLHRVSLHKALSKEGNPRLTTLAQVLGAVGLRLRIEEIPKAKRKRKSA
jgi:probable addiction module antidote protein